MKTSSIWIHAPIESDVGTIVAGEDLPRVIFVDGKFRVRDLVEVLEFRRRPRVRRIRDGTKARHRGSKRYLNICSNATAMRSGLRLLPSRPPSSMRRCTCRG